MEENEKGLELYKKHRPTKLSELVGQDDAVKMLRQMGKTHSIPHCILLTGPSGCGKTTIARILKRMLNCSDFDFNEMNIADARGIDVVREIRNRMGLAPIGGSVRVWLLDECARATTDFQNGILKILEDTPKHVYFFLATTEPQKLLGTIKTRATEIKVKALKDRDMDVLLQLTSEKEKFVLSESVREKIVESADGSPRKALVLLNQVMGLSSEEDQLAVVSAGVASAQSIELCRALLNPKVRWSEISKILKTLEEEPESLRRMVLGYANAVLLNSGSARAYDMITCFEKNYFDSGKAGLAASCFELLMPSK
jgi:DNA polymerase-3 subunit gamma/tau